MSENMQSDGVTFSLRTKYFPRPVYAPADTFVNYFYWTLPCLSGGMDKVGGFLARRFAMLLLGTLIFLALGVLLLCRGLGQTWVDLGSLLCFVCAWKTALVNVKRRVSKKRTVQRGGSGDPWMSQVSASLFQGCTSPWQQKLLHIGLEMIAMRHLESFHKLASPYLSRFLCTTNRISVDEFVGARRKSLDSVTSPSVGGSWTSLRPETDVLPAFESALEKRDELLKDDDTSMPIVTARQFFASIETTDERDMDKLRQGWTEFSAGRRDGTIEELGPADFEMVGEKSANVLGICRQAAEPTPPIPGETVFESEACAEAGVTWCSMSDCSEEYEENEMPGQHFSNTESGPAWKALGDLSYEERVAVGVESERVVHEHAESAANRVHSCDATLALAMQMIRYLVETDPRIITVESVRALLCPLASCGQVCFVEFAISYFATYLRLPVETVPDECVKSIEPFFAKRRCETVTAKGFDFLGCSRSSPWVAELLILVYARAGLYELADCILCANYGLKMPFVETEAISLAHHEAPEGSGILLKLHCWGALLDAVERFEIRRVILYLILLLRRWQMQKYHPQSSRGPGSSTNINNEEFGDDAAFRGAYGSAIHVLQWRQVQRLVNRILHRALEAIQSNSMTRRCRLTVPWGSTILSLPTVKTRLGSAGPRNSH
eukprot:Polyplicarium_translucidae@DN3190_c0_g1_i3.p1